MKTKLIFALIMIFGLLIIGCNQKVEKAKIDIVNDEFKIATIYINNTVDFKEVS